MCVVLCFKEVGGVQIGVGVGGIDMCLQCVGVGCGGVVWQMCVVLDEGCGEVEIEVDQYCCFVLCDQLVEDCGV